MIELTAVAPRPLQELLGILRRRRKLIIVTALLGTTLVGIGAVLLPPQYTAKAQIIVEPRVSGLAGSPTVVVAAPEAEVGLLTEVTRLTSHDNLERVVASLAQDSPAPPANVGPSARPVTTTDELRRSLSQWLPPLLRPTADRKPMDIEDLERRLKIYQERGSRVITIGFTSRDPREAVTIANRVAQLYVKGQESEKLAESDRVLTWLDQRVPDQRREVERLQTAVRDYQTAHGLPDKNRAGVADQLLADLNRQLAVAQTDLGVRQARLANLQDQAHRGVAAAGLVGTPERPQLTELRRQELTLLQSQADIAATLGERHPRMQQVRNQLQEVQRKLDQEVNGAVTSLANDVQIAAAEVRAIQQRIAAVHGADSDPRLEQLEHDATSSQRIYEGLQRHREELREQRELITPGVAILSLASLPTRPSSSNTILFVPPAFIVFLVGGCFLAVMLEGLDATLRSERDIQEALGIPCLGLVPRIRRTRRRRPHQLLTAQPFAPYTEAVRSVVAALGIVDARTTPKVILLSSSLPQEGKTTLAVSVAAYTALLGRRTILVDLDFRHPAVLRELAGKGGRNSDLLPADQLGPDEILHSARLNLDYLTLAGDAVDPLTRFAGDYMSRLLHRLRAAYDCVIIDSAPVLAITETRLLAGMVDKVLFVVKWGAIRRDIAKNALRLLEAGEFPWKSRSTVAGAVITQVDLRKHARYRYGDVGECLVEYGKRYLVSTAAEHTYSAADERFIESATHRPAGRVTE